MAWFADNRASQISFPAHGSSVVTCLIFSNGRIISSTDAHSIHIHSATTGTLQNTLDGHTGGVWALVVHGDTLVSGSTDKTVRVWDLNSGKCTHVFGGHEGTVRCISVVAPDPHSSEAPDKPLIISGSRDNTIRVWGLPLPGEAEFDCFSENATGDGESDEIDATKNPYHRYHLTGHEGSVRGLDVRGKTALSGSYDTTVRVWDITSGECKFVLQGHSGKVYSVLLDPKRNQAYSGSMDKTVRIWNVMTGECLHTLTAHTSLVGLLSLSETYLASASADATLCIWDPDTAALRHMLHHHTGAITCMQHDDEKVVSGSGGSLKLWDIKDGKLVRDLITGVIGVWQVVCEGDYCVVAYDDDGKKTMIQILKFGTTITGDMGSSNN